jgi:uncharacterized membrane protein
MSLGKLVAWDARRPPRLKSDAPTSRAQARVSPALALAVAFGLAFWVVATATFVVEHLTHNVYHRDYAIYVNTLWNTANGRPFQTSMLIANSSHLAEHVALVLLPLAPLSQLVPQPVLLIALQQAALALAGVPV